MPTLVPLAPLGSDRLAAAMDKEKVQAMIAAAVAEMEAGLKDSAEQVQAVKTELAAEKARMAAESEKVAGLEAELAAAQAAAAAAGGVAVAAGSGTAGGGAGAVVAALQQALEGLQREKDEQLAAEKKKTKA